MSALAILATNIANADVTLSTTYNEDIYYLGVPDTQSYGQTFTALGTELTSYSFSLDNFGGQDQDFGFYVGTWNGSSVGSVLYSQYFASSQPGAGYVTYTVTPDVATATGSQYIAFLSTSATTQGPDSMIAQAGSSDVYVDGQFVYLNNGNDPSQWFTTAWATDWPVPQTAFSATFSTPASSVPGPAAALPMVIGLATTCRRRRA